MGLSQLSQLTPPGSFVALASELGCQQRCLLLARHGILGL